MVTLQRKIVTHTKVNPADKKDLEEVFSQEKEAFGSGLEPQEHPEVMRFLAGQGDIWLQRVEENNQKITTGAISLISLANMVKVKSQHFEMGVELNSPFITAVKKEKEVFRAAKELAVREKDIIFYYDIAVSRRNQGYGTLLLKHALQYVPWGLVVCFVLAARRKGSDNQLELVPNEQSLFMHAKAGFVLVDVVDPPVYDKNLTYYCLVRPGEHCFSLGFNDYSSTRINLAKDGNAKELLAAVKEFTRYKFFGVSFDRESHEMIFKKFVGRKSRDE